MTKKSEARQERDRKQVELDQQLKGNNNWSDLHEQYAASQQLLVTPGAIAIALNNREIIACIDDLDTFNTNVRTLTGDLKSFSADLQSIYAQHKGRTGHADESNIMDAFRIVDLYSAFNMRYQAVILPVILHILEQTNAAEKKLQEHKATLMKVIVDSAVATTDQPVQGQ